MSRIVALMLVLGLSLVVVASGWAAEANTEQAKAVAEIERLGGKVVVDEKSPDKAVIAVRLERTEVDYSMIHIVRLTARPWQSCRVASGGRK